MTQSSERLITTFGQVPDPANQRLGSTSTSGYLQRVSDASQMQTFKAHSTELFLNDDFICGMNSDLNIVVQDGHGPEAVYCPKWHSIWEVGRQV